MSKPKKKPARPKPIIAVRLIDEPDRLPEAVRVDAGNVQETNRGVRLIDTPSE